MDTVVSGEKHHYSRKGFHRHSGAMLEALRLLADNRDGSGVSLASIHPRALDALQRLDEICALDIAETCFRITGRGLRALEAFSTGGYRQDGLCPTCGLRPREVSKNGKVGGLCTECRREYRNADYQEHGTRVDPNAPCSRCRAAPRARSGTGQWMRWCRACAKIVRHEKFLRQNQRKLDRIAHGEALTCHYPGCTRTVHVSGRTVRDYCYAHERQRRIRIDRLRRRKLQFHVRRVTRSGSKLIAPLVFA